MEFVAGIWAWLQANYQQLAVVLVSFIAFAEAVVKLTPTETDDGFIKRLGNIIDKLLKYIPSAKK